MNFDSLVQTITSVNRTASGMASKTINVALTLRNWLIGAYTVEYEQQGEDRAAYGDRLLSRLTEQLQKRNISRCDERELRRYRQFYIEYPQIRDSVSPEWGSRQILEKRDSSSPEFQLSSSTLLNHLSFTHFRLLLGKEDRLNRAFYESEVLPESDLEAALIEKVQTFLLELGYGFCFEARQKRLLIGGEYCFVDLVFYHRVLKCHVLVELKVDKFSHEHLGQLNTYVSYYRMNEMTAGDQPPVGILLCTDKNHALVEYALAGMDNRLFVSKYQLELPEPEALKRYIDEQRRILEDEKQ